MTPSEDYISQICSLYGDSYDDREEDSKPRGRDWTPGGSAAHKSLSAFQKELEGLHEIEEQEKWLAEAGYNAYNVGVAFFAIKRAFEK